MTSLFSVAQLLSGTFQVFPGQKIALTIGLISQLSSTIGTTEHATAVFHCGCPPVRTILGQGLAQDGRVEVWVARTRAMIVQDAHVITLLVAPSGKGFGKHFLRKAPTDHRAATGGVR